MSHEDELPMNLDAAIRTLVEVYTKPDEQLKFQIFTRASPEFSNVPFEDFTNAWETLFDYAQAHLSPKTQDETRSVTTIDEAMKAVDELEELATDSGIADVLAHCIRTALPVNKRKAEPMLSRQYGGRKEYYDERRARQEIMDAEVIEQENATIKLPKPEKPKEGEI